MATHIFKKIYQNYLSVCLSDISLFIYSFIILENRDDGHFVFFVFGLFILEMKMVGILFYLVGLF